jgi:hypothetical protein
MGAKPALPVYAARLFVMDVVGLIQWPAMLATILASWLVGSQRKHHRKWGFWVFLLSNVLWVIWGWHDHAYALIALQFALAFINIRGVSKNEQPT